MCYAFSFTTLQPLYSQIDNRPFFPIHFFNSNIFLGRRRYDAKQAGFGG
jgi:hypothetical protein